MRQKVKRIIKVIFGTENNIESKLSISLFITGILFLLFSFMLQTKDYLQTSNIFSYISAILLSMWLASSSIQGNSSPLDFFIEICRLFIFLIILVISLNFCINTSVTLRGIRLIIYSILSCIGLLVCSFYLVSKFIDIFLIIKNIFIQIKTKLFNTIQSKKTEQKTNKLKDFIENVTTFLVSIAGLGVAIKAIVEPLVNLISTLFTP